MKMKLKKNTEYYLFAIISVIAIIGVTIYINNNTSREGFNDKKQMEIEKEKEKLRREGNEAKFKQASPILRALRIILELDDKVKYTNQMKLNLIKFIMEKDKEISEIVLTTDSDSKNEINAKFTQLKELIEKRIDKET